MTEDQEQRVLSARLHEFRLWSGVDCRSIPQTRWESTDASDNQGRGGSEAAGSVLAARGLTGIRLNCQMTCESDMSVRAISRLEGSGRADAVGQLAPEIEPTAEWVEK